MIWLWLKFILTWTLICSGLVLLFWLGIISLEAWRYRKVIRRRDKAIPDRIDRIGSV